jgi:hypothetical protein
MYTRDHTIQHKFAYVDLSLKEIKLKIKAEFLQRMILCYKNSNRKKDIDGHRTSRQSAL